MGEGRASKPHEDVLRLLIAGSYGGFWQAVCAHPFDTVKSRVQTGGGIGTVEVIRQTLRNEGVLAFYKGVAPPLLFAGTYNALLFSTNAAMRRIVFCATGVEVSVDDPSLIRDPSTGRSVPPPLSYTIASALMSAPVVCFPLTPMEAVKVRLQTQDFEQHGEKKSGGTTGKRYTGMFDCLRTVAREEGLRALWSGYVPTAGTRLVGLPFYFGGIESTRHLLHDSSAVPEWSKALLAGSAGGVAFWAVCFPLDVVKTITQRSRLGAGENFFTVASALYRQSGVRAFFRGYSVTLLRAIPANASAYFAIEQCSGWLRKLGL